MAKKPVTFRLNTEVSAVWESRDGTLRFANTVDGRQRELTVDVLEGLPLKELALACVHGILDVENWDPYEFLKQEKQGKAKATTENKEPITFALAPGEIMWQSPDRTVTLSSFAEGAKTWITLERSDPRLSDFLAATRVRPARLRIVENSSDAPVRVKPELIEPGFERTNPATMNKARIMHDLPYNELLHKIATMVPKGSRESSTFNPRETKAILRAIISLEEKREEKGAKVRAKVMEIAKRALTDLGEFVVGEEQTDTYNLVPTKD